MTPARFVASLQHLAFDHVFNPYADRCPVSDLEDAPRIRSELLGKMIEAASARALDALWIGRDFSYRGGRRTGLAFTDDAYLDEHAGRWGLNVRRPVHGSMVKERSAGAVWNLLSRIESNVFLWNVFPMHPHEPGNPFSNRAHSALERNAGRMLLEHLVLLLNPSTIIAIGNDAERTVRGLGDSVASIRTAKVRHPSYGGQVEFRAGMRTLYGVR